jgi:GNAT superfamily N-acetyltransferase
MTDVAAPELTTVSIDDEATLGRWLAVRNAVDVRPLSIPAYRMELAGATGHQLVLATLDGVDVGAADVGWGAISSESHTAFLMVWVLPEWRGRGIGTELVHAALDFAWSAGMQTLRSYALDGDDASIRFGGRFGLVPVGGGQLGWLDLTAQDPAAALIPDGIEVTNLAERPDLLHDVYELDELVRPEIPTMALEPSPSFEAWQAQVSGDPGFLPELSLVAMREGRLVGSMLIFDNAEGTAFIGMTAVHPDARRLGIARSLKTELAARAARTGWKRIETYNDGTNERMRGLNIDLGYVYLPKEINLKGPIPAR